jgi:hypothetical protein
LGALCFCWLLAIGSAASSPYEGQGVFAPLTRIDELVAAQWKESCIQPARICSDAVFIRRACLDVMGTLPSAYEARDFILDKKPNKRSALIDRLMERDEFADYWAMKWGDLLRVKAEFPINLWPNAAQAYHRWIRTRIKENTPYDRIVRELLTARGSNFESPPVNFYRAVQSKDPRSIAQTVALTFMGARADKWPGDALTSMAVFFANIGYKTTSEWKEEIIFFNPASTNAGALKDEAITAAFPDGTRISLAPGKDPREAFADWLTAPGNPWFARAMANRIWFWLLGRGIVHEPDDIRPDNPPSNEELLALLERELIASKYNLKQIFKLILNSQTYQLSSLPNSKNPRAPVSFASYPLRRLDAEVLMDALNSVTGATEKYTSTIPEPYTVIPTGTRSITLPDGSISSSFLELFGRPARDTGLESERNNRMTDAQKLYLLNSSAMLRKIEQSRMLQFQTKAGRTPAEIVSSLYLGILSRFPTQDELKTAEAYFRSGKVARREAVIDLSWALMNSSEFLYRH